MQSAFSEHEKRYFQYGKTPFPKGESTSSHHRFGRSGILTISSTSIADANHPRLSERRIFENTNHSA